MRGKKLKYDSDYDKVIEQLKTNHGWNFIEVLPVTFRDLINAVIIATKQVNKQV